MPPRPPEPQLAADVRRYAKAAAAKARAVPQRATRTRSAARASSRRRRAAAVVTAHAPQPDVLKRRTVVSSRRRSRVAPTVTTRKRAPVDPYCQSANDILQETHDGKLAAIHRARVACDRNPFLSSAYCKRQTDDAVDQLREATEAARKAQAEGDAKDGHARAAFVPPATDDPAFNQKWSDCFAGPRHSACDCNFVVRNDRHPKRHQCEFGTTIRKESFHPQQRLVSEYIKPGTPYRGLLCYHGLGSGKTIAMIGVLAKFLQFEPTRTILVVAPPKLRQNFRDDLAKTETATLFGDQAAKTMTPAERERRIGQQLNLLTFEELANRLNGMTAWSLPANKQTSKRLAGGRAASEEAGYGSLASDDDASASDASDDSRASSASSLSSSSDDPPTPNTDAAAGPPDTAPPRAGRGFGALPEGTRRADTPEDPMLNNTLLMIDEAHDLVTPEEAKYPPPDKAFSVVSAMRRATDCRILLMTATPMRNQPYELGILLNMLKAPDDTTKFPEVHVQKRMSRATVDIVDRPATKALFDDLFVETDATGLQRLKNEALFLRKCKGLVSFFPVDNLYTMFPKKREHLVEVPLPDDAFVAMREKMEAEHKALAKKGKAYPGIRDHKLECLTSRKASNVLGHTKALVVNRVKADAKAAAARLAGEGAPSRATKMQTIAQHVARRASVGKQFVYSFFDIQGCLALMTQLALDGWTQLEAKDLVKHLKPEYRPFREINKESFADLYNRPLDDPECARHSELDAADANARRFVVLGLKESDGRPFAQWKQKLLMLAFNAKRNRRGTYINVLIGNRGYAKGISLMAVRTEHLVEPSLSVADSQQIVARGVRSCSHKTLDFPRDWTVEVYTYFGTHPSMASYKGGVAADADDEEGDDEGEAFVPAPRRVSLRKPAGGRPPKRQPKKQRLLRYNPCADTHTTEAACNRSEFCHWDKGAQLCKSLPIDFAVRKMAVMRDEVNRRFLELLQLAAIDCEVFRELHDDRSRACFTVDPVEMRKAPRVRRYRGYNEDEGEDTEVGEAVTHARRSSRSEAAATDPATAARRCAAIRDDDRCRADPACYVSHNTFGGTTCRPKAAPLGSVHAQCPTYYDDQVACDRDPMCRWGPTRGTRKARASTYKCHNKYLPQLTVRNPQWLTRARDEATEHDDRGHFTFALGDTTSKDPTLHWRVYPMKHKKALRSEKGVEAVLDQLTKRADKGAAATDGVPLLDVLETLYELVEQNARTVRARHKALRTALEADEQTHRAEWTAQCATVNQWMARIGEVYTAVLRADEATKAATRSSRAAAAELVPRARRSRRSSAASSSPSSSTVSSAAATPAATPVPVALPLPSIQQRLLLSLKPDGDKHRLNVLRDRHHQTHLHYQFHLYYKGKRYLFDSKEQEGAAVALANVPRVQQVHKRFVLRDLSVRLCFLFERQRVYKVEMRVYTRIGKTGAHGDGGGVHTVEVGLDGKRTRAFTRAV